MRVRILAVLALLAVAVGLVYVLAGGTSPARGPAPASVPSASRPPAGVDDPAQDPALARFYRQRLAWKGCKDEVECASLTVPVDWSKPAGPTLAVAVFRYRATGPRVGSLVFNPGGPGVAVEGYVRKAPTVAGRTLLRHLDFVGFDPRGVGRSSPVRCLPDARLDAFVSADATPDDAAEVRSAVDSTRRFVAACTANTGALLGHVDTLSVVRDMDVLRAALGDGRLTYWGASYGTFIGAWYAQTFPWRVGRLVLDGAVDPTLTSQQYSQGQAEGFERALRAYVEDCLGEPGCPVRGSTTQGLDQIVQMVDAADTQPLRTKSGRPLTQSLMITGIATALYDDSLWPLLTAGLRDATSGDGTTLLRLADVYLERDSSGHYGQALAATPAIYCLDHPEELTLAQIQADAAAQERRYAPIGGANAWSALTCLEWPVRPVLRPQRLTAPGAAPILVVGTVGDPATPYAWAVSLSSPLSSARLLTWEGQGHTAFRRGSTCIDDAVDAYLLNGSLPARGTRCPA